MRTVILCAVIAAGAAWGMPARVAEASPRAGAASAEATAPEATAPEAAAPEAAALEAAALYDRFCLACHGTFGDGQGPAAPWLWPRPRDLTRGEYKWRSTPAGAPPTDRDLAAAIRYGVPGTSMHGFGAGRGGALGEREIGLLVDHLKSLAPDVFTAPAVPIEIGAPPAITDALVARGQEIFGALGCVACHGEAGRGDGALAAGLRDAEGSPAAPPDLTSVPLRRPAARIGLAEIYTTIATGLSGTPMPGYLGAVPDADLWAVAAYIDAIRARDPAARPAAMSPVAIARDRETPAAPAGFWPGRGTAEERAIFGEPLGPQGPAPGALAPAQASLSALQCARCHSKQLGEWQGSIHAAASSPGFMGQLLRMERAGNLGVRGDGATASSCQRCHAPLAEQRPFLPVADGGDGELRHARNPRFDDVLRLQGVSCASCHVRGWQRMGPPRADGSMLLALPGYPRTELRIYERSDFCLPCHQLPPRQALAGKPLLDTYREWLESPYMPRGVQCQHCHMPGREHTWKGVHDPDTFRQGIRVEAIAGRSARTGAVSVRARVTNVGAGHYLPTTPTPAAWLGVQLVDQRGRPIAGARAERRIGRKLGHDRDRGFVELEDTRIPPGQNLELAAAWKDGDVARATAARVTVRVAPDDHYETVYRRRLRGRLDADVRALFEEALRRAEASHYVAHERLVLIE